MLRTVGIDLAAQPKNTALCALDWNQTGVKIARLRHDLTDAEIGGLVGGALAIAKIGIDAPFGWPTAFVDALVAWGSTAEWHTPVAEPSPGTRRLKAPPELVFRTTDRYVADHGKRPLSVSTDRIAYTAFRCAHLLTLLSDRQPVDRTGRGLLCEVYPAAALHHWGIDLRGIKASTAAGAESRLRALAGLEVAADGRLRLNEQDRAQLASNDHLFDALISALVARAAYLGRTPLPAEHAYIAAIEGWIHVPSTPFSSLFTDAQA